MALPSTKNRVLVGRNFASQDNVFDYNVVKGPKARARQVIHLTGYRMGVEVNQGTFADGDFVSLFLMLMAHDSDRNLSPGAIMSEENIDRASTIDVVHYGQFYDLVTSGAANMNNPLVSDWVNCDIVVPAVHLHVSSLMNNVTAFDVWAVLEMEWVDATAAEIAAVMFQWGMDPQDFDP